MTIPMPIMIIQTVPKAGTAMERSGTAYSQECHKYVCGRWSLIKQELDQ